MGREEEALQRDEPLGPGRAGAAGGALGYGAAGPLGAAVGLGMGLIAGACYLVRNRFHRG
jgi:hypothetical protein